MSCHAKIKAKNRRQCQNDVWLFFYCKKHWLDLIRKYRILVGGILLVVISVISDLVGIVDILKSDHRKFTEERYITGIIAPLSMKQQMVVNIGDSGLVTKFNPHDWGNSTQWAGCADEDDKGNIVPGGLKYQLSIENDVIVISIRIRDTSGNRVAEIVRNRISIDKDLIADYSSDDRFLYSSTRSLEILDRKGYVPFSLWLDQKDQLHMRGYFYGDQCVVFLDGGVMKVVYHDDPRARDKIQMYASRIKPRFLGPIADLEMSYENSE